MTRTLVSVAEPEREKLLAAIARAIAAIARRTR